MGDKSTVDKLRVLVPHWIEHNHSHKAEFVKWAAAAREEGLGEVAGLIDKAVATMDQADEALGKALIQLGGAKGGDHHHHHHHHD